MKTHTSTRRGFLRMAGIGAAATAAARAGRGANSDAARPNVLLILVDDLGFGDLSSFGARDLKTPNIDKLFAAGVRVDPFYANCPVCSPTRAATLTGRFPDLVGVPGVIRTYARSNWGHLTPQAVLLPRVLKSRGYHSAIVGKWHLGIGSPNTPTERGFDYFKGFLGDMMDDYYKHRRHGINYMRLGRKTIDPKGHATDLFTQWAVDCLRQRAARSEPFFLYLAYNAPHTPIQPPPDWLKRVKARQAGLSDKRARLVALIEHLDDGIGKVLAALKATGQADNTLVIFTSDNGGQVNVGGTNGPLKGGKQQMDEGGIRVPMCAVWPGRITPGTRADRLAMTMDLFPTICAAAGATFDHEIDGRSILPTLLAKRQKAEDRFLFWPRLEGGRYRGKIYYAARYGPWKLTQNRAEEPYRLYNLADDPKETRPFGKDHPKYKLLHDALKAHIAKAAKVPWRRPGT